MSEIAKTSENRETKIATALQALTPRELDAYKYFLRVKQAEISEEAADKLYSLFLQGQSCEDIRRTSKGYGLGQIIAARIVYEWDLKASAYREHLVATVPVQAEQTHLEVVDYVGNLLKATYLKHSEKLRLYFTTGDTEHLDGVPLPKNVKELNALMELFMKATGNDKKRVEVTGNLNVNHSATKKGQITSEEASSILDQLIEGNVIDVDAKPVRKSPQRPK